MCTHFYQVMINLWFFSCWHLPFSPIEVVEHITFDQECNKPIAKLNKLIDLYIPNFSSLLTMAAILQQCVYSCVQRFFFFILSTSFPRARNDIITNYIITENVKKGIGIFITYISTTSTTKMGKHLRDGKVALFRLWQANEATDERWGKNALNAPSKIGNREKNQHQTTWTLWIDNKRCRHAMLSIDGNNIHHRQMKKKKTKTGKAVLFLFLFCSSRSGVDRNNILPVESAKSVKKSERV